MPDTFDIAVIGAGVVGLSVARRLARAGREVIVLEAEAGIGVHTSGRNSEVLHAGLYYPPGSRKARLCLRGRAALLEYCGARGVPYALPGKLIVATSDGEVEALVRIEERARACGAEELRWMEPAEVEAMEPAVRCVRALHSPGTGIVDSHALLRSLRADAEEAGARVLLRVPVRRGWAEPDGVALLVGDREAERFRFRRVVNTAGLGAQAVAARIEGVRLSSVPPLHLAKGHYAVLAGRAPISRLVYPVPEPGGLGVHVTVDLAGNVRFGPDVQWIDRVDYSFDEGRIEGFYPAIRRYFPGLPDGGLRPGFTGIRPKLAGPGADPRDFEVHGVAEHGVAGLICLYGIESPGLTAALALADEVALQLAG